ncbi:MAG: iron-sulfur cluster assembly protein [bacterium]|nr:iron-sulfur cluster assembly protein [bacterium]
MLKITPVPKEKRTETYWKELNKVVDPEVGIGVVDMGLIYDVKIDKDDNCIVYMTLTSPSCPVGPMLLQQVEDQMRIYKDLNSVQAQIVWDPYWSQEMIDEDLREMMFGA